MLQDRAAAATHPAAARQFSRERLRGIKHAGNLTLVPRQDDALRKRFANQNKALRREALQANRSAGRNLVLLVRAEFNDGRFLIAPCEYSCHARLQATKKFFLRSEERRVGKE